MNASYEHPSLRTPVTQEQRDRAAEHLQAAYAEGRISEEEFDRRIGQVLGAVTRKDLNDAFYGLVEVPYSSSGQSFGPSYGQTYGQTHAPSYGSGPWPTPYGANYPARQQGTPGGALAHFSGLFTSIVGPGVGYAVSSPGSLARKESAKAFNFQLISLVAVVIGGTLQAITDSGLISFLVGLGWIAWVVLSIVGGVKAARGEDWTNPVKKVVKVNVLPEK